MHGAPRKRRCVRTNIASTSSDDEEASNRQPESPQHQEPKLVGEVAVKVEMDLAAPELVRATAPATPGPPGPPGPRTPTTVHTPSDPLEAAEGVAEGPVYFGPFGPFDTFDDDAFLAEAIAAAAAVEAEAAVAQAREEHVRATLGEVLKLVHATDKVPGVDSNDCGSSTSSS